ELLAVAPATSASQNESADPPIAEPSDEDLPETGAQPSQRFVLRAVDAPLAEADKSLFFARPSLILGDNPTAAALRRRLAENGLTTLDLPVGGADETLAALEHHWESQPAPQLFLMTARDEDASQLDDASAWNRRRERGVLLPYLVCQRWLGLLSASKLLDQATLVAVTGLGGDFGLSGRGSAPEGGALAGLLKAIRHEYLLLNVKVIDAPLEEAPAAVAAAGCRGLANRAPENEGGVG